MARKSPLDTFSDLKKKRASDGILFSAIRIRALCVRTSACACGLRLSTLVRNLAEAPCPDLKSVVRVRSSHAPSFDSRHRDHIFQGFTANLRSEVAKAAPLFRCLLNHGDFVAKQEIAKARQDSSPLGGAVEGLLDQLPGRADTAGALDSFGVLNPAQRVYAEFTVLKLQARHFNGLFMCLHSHHGSVDSRSAAAAHPAAASFKGLLAPEKRGSNSCSRRDFLDLNPYP